MKFEDPIKNTLYCRWTHMRQRCNNPNNKDYKWYGGKGISICTEWNNFHSFYQWAKNNGFSQGLTLDRINVDGNYEPDNCRWITIQEQQNNKHNNINITIGDETKTISQWAKEKEINERTLRGRYALGTKIENLFVNKKDFAKKNGKVGRGYANNAKKILITYNGKTQCIAQWAKDIGISPEALSQRLSKNIPIEIALLPKEEYRRTNKEEF